MNTLAKKLSKSLEGLVYLIKVAREVAYIYLCKVAVGKGSLKGHGYLGKVAGKGLYKAGEEVGQWGLEDVASTMDHIID